MSSVIALAVFAGVPGGSMGCVANACPNVPSVSALWDTSSFSIIVGLGYGSTDPGSNVDKSGSDDFTPWSGTSIFALQKMPFSTRVLKSSTRQLRK